MLITPVQPAPISKMSTAQRIANSIGNYIPDKISNTFEMKRIGTLGRIPLFLISLVFVLGARLYKSRDAHERREVLTRDSITVGAAMLAVPVVKTWMQRGVDKLSKIPTATENSKFFSLEDFGFDNIKNWYSKANLMPEKVLTMAQNIVNRKGDLAKAFGTLGDEGMNFVKTMLNGKKVNSNNILEALKTAHNSTDETIKGAFNGLTELLSKEDNNLVKSAQRLKAIPAIASLVGVTALLGWGIPAFNIKLTRKILKGHNNKQQNEVNSKNVQHQNLEPKFLGSQQVIIDSFLSNKK